MLQSHSQSVVYHLHTRRLRQTIDKRFQISNSIAQEFHSAFNTDLATSQFTKLMNFLPTGTYFLWIWHCWTCHSFQCNIKDRINCSVYLCSTFCLISRRLFLFSIYVLYVAVAQSVGGIPLTHETSATHYRQTLSNEQFQSTRNAFCIQHRLSYKPIHKAKEFRPDWHLFLVKVTLQNPLGFSSHIERKNGWFRFYRLSISELRSANTQIQSNLIIAFALLAVTVCNTILFPHICIICCSRPISRWYTTHTQAGCDILWTNALKYSISAHKTFIPHSQQTELHANSKS